MTKSICSGIFRLEMLKYDKVHSQWYFPFLDMEKLTKSLAVVLSDFVAVVFSDFSK